MKNVFRLLFFFLLASCTAQPAQPTGPGPSSDSKEVQKQKIPKIKKISSGEKVDIKSHLVAGKYTVIEFYADW